MIEHDLSQDAVDKMVRADLAHATGEPDSPTGECVLTVRCASGEITRTLRAGDLVVVRPTV